MTRAIEIELATAEGYAARGMFEDSFRSLERAHTLSQSSTFQHVRVHYRMLRWAVQRQDGRELFGLLVRIVGADVKTAIGLVPAGNTGGANVSIFRAMPVPEDLKPLLSPSNLWRRAAAIIGLPGQVGADRRPNGLCPRPVRRKTSTALAARS